MPTFCYYSELSVYGACRMCVVEDERGKIDASCSMEPRDGMVIRTNTARLLKHLSLIHIYRVFSDEVGLNLISF